jgi:hypothetical protein
LCNVDRDSIWEVAPTTHETALPLTSVICIYEAVKGFSNLSEIIDALVSFVTGSRRGKSCANASIHFLVIVREESPVIGVAGFLARFHLQK